MTSTSVPPQTAPHATPPEPEKPEGAEALTVAANLAFRDDVQSWHPITERWYDAANGAETAADIVWWRWAPRDTLDEIAAWVEGFCNSDAETFRLSDEVRAHGRQLAAQTRAISDEVQS